ncbi:MAG: fibronectin type III domain-containing protein, partial [Bacteroidales bacterium]|nr:fibronectin type III domain-containing protein [Bacteroidales bacterium]
MKKHLSFLLMALFMAIGSFAQTQYNIIVGNGTGTNHFMPAYTYYNYSVSQTIYHQDEINLAGTINSISWSVATNSATRTWKVYLAETELDNFTSSADQLPEASFTEVYNGSVTITAGGLATIELTTPFEYSNEANLVVAVLDMSGSYTSYNNEPYFYVTNHNDGTRTYYSYRDGSAYAVNAGGSASSDTPNIILGIESNDFYCSAPMTIAKTDATTSSITVAWNEVDASTGYILQYKLASETSWDDAQEVSTSDTTYEIQGLESNTAYSIRVQNACGSSWTSCSARTACEAIATIPWFEDFESYEGNGELEFECWDAIVKPNGPFVYGGYAPPCHSGVNSAEFKGNVNVLVLPEFEEDLGNLRLTFWTTATNTSAGNIRVGYITDLADTNTFVATGNSIAAAARGTSGSGNGNIQGPFDFSGAPQGARIALFYTSTSSNASWNLDDFTVDYIPECAEPTNVTVSNVAAHTADIAWSSEESSFVVSYKASSASDDEWMEESTSDNPYTITGLAPETAYTVKVGVPCGDGSIAYSLERTFTTTIACPAPTGITVSDITTNTATISWTGNGESFYVKAKPATATEWEIEEEAYENTIELQGLASSTIYTVQVIANCGDEDGVSQSASATFQTECGVVSTFPYIEGFESTSLGCWTSEVISGSSNWITSTSYKHSGSRSAYFTYTTNYSARLVSPVFDLSSLTTPKLSYYRYIRPYNGQADSLAVYYRTSPESEWVYLHGAKVADNDFVKIEEILPEPSETYQISFVSLGCDQWGMYIDDFKVEEAPACNPPTQLASSNITTTSVDLTWTGTADSYTIYYKATSATEYETIAGVTLTDEVYTLENLNAATQYTWYVASECED